MHGRNKKEPESISPEIKSPVLALTGDLSDPQVPSYLVEETVRHHGYLDGIVNNAGISPRHSIDTATAEDFDDIDFLISLGVNTIKISSADSTNFPLIKYASKTNKVIQIDTGGTTPKEIKETINFIKNNKNKK